jgi:hypothetical protein
LQLKVKRLSAYVYYLDSKEYEDIDIAQLMRDKQIAVGEAAVWLCVQKAGPCDRNDPWVRRGG